MCNIFILSRYIDYLLYIYIYIYATNSLSLSLVSFVSIIEIIITTYQLLRRKEGKEEKTSRKETVTKEKNIQGGGHDRGQRGKLFHPLS